ncbi:AAA family ATPase [Paenibacillus daejeonensis]|uniref:AAA family ATPase n=1 Tax=Paenibacillus daejeonensis TaxID=135193 RepID=UPI0003715F3E|nr:AAA family ATPase [Paenibacillus daejeonensis]
MPVPYLLIVNGLPGSGKTTLAQRLAQDLAVPRFARDGIYETLYDAMHRPSDEAHPALGHGAFAMMYYAAGQILSVGRSCLVEGYYGRPALRSGEFHQLQQRYPYEPIQLLCKADGEVLVERFLARMASESRHGGHADQAWLEANRELLLQGELTPLSVGGTLIEVDTTTPERMNYEALLTQIRTKMTVTDL